MAKKAVTLNFNESEYDQLVSDAEEAGHESAGTFAKEIVLSRGEPLAPAMDRQSEMKLLKLQGANELLQAQLDTALKGNTGTGLAGTPEPVLGQKAMNKQLEEMLKQKLAERDAVETEAKYKQLLVDYAKLESDYDKLEDKYDEAVGKLSSNDRWERLAPHALGAVARVAVEKFPQHAEGLTAALAGIAGGAMPAPALPAGDATSALVTELQTMLTEDERAQVHEILNGLMDFPALIPKVGHAVHLGAQQLSQQQEQPGSETPA